MDEVPPLTTIWVAVAEWRCLCFRSLTQRVEEEANQLKMARFFSTKSTHAHPRVIGNMPAKFEVNVTNVFCAMQGRNRQRFLAFIVGYGQNVNDI